MKTRFIRKAYNAFQQKLTADDELFAAESIGLNVDHRNRSSVCTQEGGDSSPQLSRENNPHTRPMHLNGTQRRRSLAFAALSAPSPGEAEGHAESTFNQGGEEGEPSASLPGSFIAFSSPSPPRKLKGESAADESDRLTSSPVAGSPEKGSAIPHSAIRERANRRVSITTRGINVTLVDEAMATKVEEKEKDKESRLPSKRGAQNLHTRQLQEEETMSPSPPPRRKDASQLHPPVTSRSSPSPLPPTLLVPSDQLSPELLGLIRTFRQVVERAIVDGEAEEGGISPERGGGGDRSHLNVTSIGGISHRQRGGREGDASPSSLVFPRYVGAELNQACNDVIRYVTQFMKHKKDEFTELLVKHVRWGQPTRANTAVSAAVDAKVSDTKGKEDALRRQQRMADEEARGRAAAAEEADKLMAQAEAEGPHYLTTLYGLVESLMVTCACDRAILYTINPTTHALVGIVYGGGNGIPIQVPISVSLAAQRSTSNTGGPASTTIHPAVVSFLSDVGINIADMQTACPPEIAVGAFDHLMAGYTTRNTLCVPVADLGLIPRGRRGRKVGGKTGVSAFAAKDDAADGSLSEDGGGGGLDATEDDADASLYSEPKAPFNLIGVLQLINRRSAAPSGAKRAASVASSSSVAVGRGDTSVDSVRNRDMLNLSQTSVFTELDELSAVHTANQIATVLAWASLSRVDFLSTIAMKHSAQLQHMHYTIRQRQRAMVTKASALGLLPMPTTTQDHDEPSRLGQKQALLGKPPSASPRNSATKRLTHTSDLRQKKAQAVADAQWQEEARALVCGDVIDAVESAVVGGMLKGGGAKEKESAFSRAKASSLQSPRASKATHSPSPQRAPGSKSSAFASVSEAIATVRSITDRMFNNNLTTAVGIVVGQNPTMLDSVATTEDFIGAYKGISANDSNSEGGGGGSVPAVGGSSSTVPHITNRPLLRDGPLLMHRITSRKLINMASFDDLKGSAAVKGRITRFSAEGIPSDGPNSRGGGGEGEEEVSFSAMDLTSGGMIDVLTQSDPPSILDATQAYTHLKGAWKHIHTQLTNANETLRSVQRELDSEKAKTLMLEAAVRKLTHQLQQSQQAVPNGPLHRGEDSSIANALLPPSECCSQTGNLRSVNPTSGSLPIFCHANPNKDGKYSEWSRSKSSVAMGLDEPEPVMPSKPVKMPSAAASNASSSPKVLVNHHAISRNASHQAHGGVVIGLGVHHGTSPARNGVKVGGIDPSTLRTAVVSPALFGLKET